MVLKLLLILIVAGCPLLFVGTSPANTIDGTGVICYEDVADPCDEGAE